VIICGQKFSQRLINRIQDTITKHPDISRCQLSRKICQWLHCEKYGYLGGLAFSAAAWRLSDRDHWIGWDEPARKKHLNQVVCNSRFLIHPHIKVKNLASHVLSLCIKRLAEDWEKRYGIRPVLLETFVERDRFTGTSYLAGNWRQVGKTKGRGRQDVGNRSSQAIKDIYLYELRANARERLCDGRPRRECQPQAPVDWADEELSRAELGDKRRVERLLTMARDFYANPRANIPQACGSKAKTKAAYRFFDEKEKSLCPRGAVLVAVKVALRLRCVKLQSLSRRNLFCIHFTQ